MKILFVPAFLLVAGFLLQPATAQPAAKKPPYMRISGTYTNIDMGEDVVGEEIHMFPTDHGWLALVNIAAGGGPGVALLAPLTEHDNKVDIIFPKPLDGMVAFHGTVFRDRLEGAFVGEDGKSTHSIMKRKRSYWD